MHTRGNVDDISRDTDASCGARIGPLVHPAGLRAAGDIMQEGPIQHHLYVGVTDAQQLPNSDFC